MNSLYITAFSMGLFGSLHCIGMCGGITIAFNQAVTKEKTLQLTFIYQFFRIISYSILGAISASLGYLLSDVKLPILTILSGLFMIFLGLYLLNIGGPLLSLEKFGHKIWKKIQPLQRSLLPMRNGVQAMSIGLLWGFLPCGLVYSALVLAITSASPLEGFVTMLCFGLGTLPMLMSIGLASQKILTTIKKPLFIRIAAVIFIAWGAFYIYSALSAQHQHHSEQTSQHHQHHH